MPCCENSVSKLYMINAWGINGLGRCSKCAPFRCGKELQSRAALSDRLRDTAKESSQVS